MLSLSDSIGARSASNGTLPLTVMKGIRSPWALMVVAASLSGSATPAEPISAIHGQLLHVTSTESTYNVRVMLSVGNYRPKTRLAQRLLSIRQQAISNGVTLISAADILSDLRRARERSV